jgi:hypothetical protein
MDQKHSFVLSKRSPTSFSTKVAADISEVLELSFVPCGNSVRVFSLKTGLLIQTVRELPSQSPVTVVTKNENGLVLKRGNDVHRSDLVAINVGPKMTAEGEYGDIILMTLCARGYLSEWDTETWELISCT